MYGYVYSLSSVELCTIILPCYKEKHHTSIRMLSNCLSEKIYFWRKFCVFFLEIFGFFISNYPQTSLKNWEKNIHKFSWQFLIRQGTFGNAWWLIRRFYLARQYCSLCSTMILNSLPKILLAWSGWNQFLDENAFPPNPPRQIVEYFENCQFFVQFNRSKLQTYVHTLPIWTLVLSILLKQPSLTEGNLHLYGNQHTQFCNSFTLPDTVGHFTKRQVVIDFFFLFFCFRFRFFFYEKKKGSYRGEGENSKSIYSEPGADDCEREDQFQREGKPNGFELAGKMNYTQCN